jgi:hypothetical protein
MTPRVGEAVAETVGVVDLDTTTDWVPAGVLAFWHMTMTV